MSTKRTVPSQSSLRVVFTLGIFCAIGLIGYGKLLIPATNDLSLAAAILVLVVYAVIAWSAPPRIEERWPRIVSASAPFSILAGVIFVSEVLLEYILLPANNAQMGFVEFGLITFVYALAGALAANRYASIGAGAVAAATAAIVSSLFWFVAVLAAFYCFRGSLRQELVFRGYRAGFYHLLIGPFIRGHTGCRRRLYCDDIPNVPRIMSHSSQPRLLVWKTVGCCVFHLRWRGRGSLRDLFMANCSCSPKIEECFSRI